MIRAASTYNEIFRLSNEPITVFETSFNLKKQTETLRRLGMSLRFIVQINGHCQSGCSYHMKSVTENSISQVFAEESGKSKKNLVLSET